MEEMAQSEARERFLEVALRYKDKAKGNFNALMKLANEIIRAEDAGLKIDAESVERAVLNVLGVYTDGYIERTERD